MTTPVQGQQASYAHPVGRVHGTIAQVQAKRVLLDVRMAEGMPPRQLWFTLRGDGTYRQAGKGPKSPVLELVPLLTTADANVLHRAGLTLPQWQALTDAERADLRWRLGA